MPTALREAAGKLALLLVGSVVGLGTAEAMIRVTNGSRYGDRPTFYPRDAELGWTPAPNLDHVYYGGDYSIAVATDEDGNRLGRLGAVSEDVERVVLLGDSYTFGWGVSTQETYASQLDDLLVARAMRAVNLGVSGYGTMQSAARLERYLAAHPSVPLAAIVLLHSHNDPSDNVVFAAVQRGLKEYIEAPRNSGIHVHSLLRLVGRAMTRDEEERGFTLPGGHRDFLWTVGAFPTDAGRAVEQLVGAPPGSDEELLWKGQEVLPTYERASLTRLQRELLRESIGRINEIGRAHGVPVLHVTIHTAPDWYVEPIRALVEETAAGDPHVLWCGRLSMDGYSGPEENDHSGGHFTPPLNGHYARLIAGWLGRGACP